MTLAEVERLGTPIVPLTGDKVVGISSPVPISSPFDKHEKCVNLRNRTHHECKGGFSGLWEDVNVNFPLFLCWRLLSFRIHVVGCHVGAISICRLAVFLPRASTTFDFCVHNSCTLFYFFHGMRLYFYFYFIVIIV